MPSGFHLLFGRLFLGHMRSLNLVFLSAVNFNERLWLRISIQRSDEHKLVRGPQRSFESYPGNT